jgi:hypothetical protein
MPKLRSLSTLRFNSQRLGPLIFFHYAASKLAPAKAGASSRTPKERPTGYHLACLFPSLLLSLTAFFSQKIDEFYLEKMFQQNPGSIP